MLFDAEEHWIPVINDMGKKKQIWDMTILVLAIVSSFTVGFELILKDMKHNDTYTAFVIIADILFWIDIFVQFRTTYISVEGEEVRDGKKIAIRYLKGMFIIDLIATISWQFIFTGPIQLLKIFKVTRITRFSKVIEKMEMKEDVKAMVKIFKLILTLLLIMHIIGCLWYLVVTSSHEWTPPLDYIYVQRGSYYRFYDNEQVTDIY